MMKFLKYLVFFLTLIIDIDLVMKLFSRGYPVESPVFWISAAFETMLAYLAYRYWIRSLAGVEFRNDRFWAIVMVLAAFGWPILVTYGTNSEVLKPAISTDRVFLAVILTLASFHFFKDNYIRLFQLFRKR